MINIAGVMVSTRPEHMLEAEQQLLQLAGVEVHAAQDGRLVVTVECPNEQAIADTLEQIQQLPAVLSAAMVYHSFNELDEMTQEVTSCN